MNSEHNPFSSALVNAHTSLSRPLPRTLSNASADSDATSPSSEWQRGLATRPMIDKYTEKFPEQTPPIWGMTQSLDEYTEKFPEQKSPESQVSPIDSDDLNLDEFWGTVTEVNAAVENLDEARIVAEEEEEYEVRNELAAAILAHRPWWENGDLYCEKADLPWILHCEQ